MDAPDIDPRDLRRSLWFIRLVNRLLQYNRSTLRHLKRFSRNWKPGETIRIIDLATGSADLPIQILRWSTKRGYDVRVVGIDLHERTIDEARRMRSTLAPPLRERLHLVRGDALRLPFHAGSFDYAITSLFLHHLDDDQAEQVLRIMGRIARRGIIATDLLRRRRAYLWISLFTLFASPMLRHDARVSVAQAFSRREVLDMRARAGVNFARFHVDFGHRFALAGERADVIGDS